MDENMDQTDIIVLAIGSVVVVLAIAVAIAIIYCGYCQQICGCCKSDKERPRSSPDRRTQTRLGGAGYNLKARTSLVPLTSDDVLDQYASGQLGELQRQGIFLPAGIDSRPPALPVESLELPAGIDSRPPALPVESLELPAGIDSRPPALPVESLELPAGIDSRPPAPPVESLEVYDDEDKALDMGLVLVPGQALSDLDGGDYNYPDAANVDNDGTSAPPLQPRRSGSWGVVRQRLLPPRQVVLDDVVEVTGRNADHAEDHYATVGGCFRYLAPKRVTTLEEIGYGEFGTVCRGTWSSEEQGEIAVALKSLKEGTTSTIGERKLIDEGRIMSAFDHPNIIRLFGAVIFDSTITLVLELITGGSLLNHLSKLRPDPGKEIDPSLAGCLLSLAQDVASGLTYLAEKNFIHRDLAARNILISGDSVAKISDFGMSRLLSDDHYYTSHGGKLPFKWCPPEVINYRKFSLASDMWSFGVVLHEIWSFGRKPYFPMDNETVLKKVCEGYRMHPPPGCSRKIYAIMADCWNPDRRKRPTAAKAHATLAANTAALLQLDSAARRKLSGVPEEAYQLGADVHHSRQLYHDITARYSHIDHDVGGLD